MKPLGILRSALLGAVAFLPLTLGAAAPFTTQDSRQKLDRRLEVRMESLDWYSKDEPLTLRFTVSNPTAESLWILRWQLPSEDMDANLFQVTRNGEPVEYTGRLVKRATPEAEDYIEIKPYGVLTVEFDPSANYDIGEQGSYGFQFRSGQVALRTAPPESRQQLEAMAVLRDREARLANLDTRPTHVAELEGRTSARLWFEGLPGHVSAKPEPSVIGGYTSCTTTQKTQLQTALANAATIATKAKNNQANNSMYAYWFGAYDANRFNTVKAHFTNLSSALSTKSFNFDCKCKKAYYAYVYPNQPYKVYLCKVFWTAPAMGRDSKAGTLVHETSHFTVVAGTQDYVYGATGAHNLALSNPANAIMNADNHEYFAEDQP